MFEWRLRIWLVLILVALAVPLPSRAVSGVGAGDNGRIDAISYRTNWRVAHWPDQPTIHVGDDVLDVAMSKENLTGAQRTELPRFAVVLVLVVMAASSVMRRRTAEQQGQLRPELT